MMNMKYRSERRSKEHYLNTHEPLILPLSSQDSLLFSAFRCYFTSVILFCLLLLWQDCIAHTRDATDDCFGVSHSLDFIYPSLQNLTIESKFDSKWGLSFLLDCKSRLLSQFESGSLVSLGDIWMTCWSCVCVFSSLHAGRTLKRISIFMTMPLSFPGILWKNGLSCTISAAFNLHSTHFPKKTSHKT